MDGFFPGIVAAVIVIVFGMFLTPISDGVNLANFKNAETACESAGGVVKVYRPNYFDGTYTVACVDGRKVILDGTNPQESLR
jgi:hypothetical protein